MRAALRTFVILVTLLHLSTNDWEVGDPPRVGRLPRGPMAVSFVLLFVAGLDSFHHGEWLTARQRYLVSLT